MSELGNGFCYIGNEYKIKIGDRYNYMDWDSFEPDPNCAGTDWLFNSNYQWLMSPISGYSYSSHAWRVHGSGYVHDGDIDGVDVEFGVRPLAILKSNVIKTGGSGASGDPYKIALSE